MDSEAQITANRRNSQKSTGPRRDEGKAASSQNAVKHGLFAHEAVIHGEDPAEFDLYREVFLADLRPVGPMESMLAERIVSLSWRLQRAERIQNEAINEQILKVSGSRVARVTRSLLPKGVRQTLADSGAMEHDPSLGRAIRSMRGCWTVYRCTNGVSRAACSGRLTSFDSSSAGAKPNKRAPKRNNGAKRAAQLKDGGAI